MTIEEKIGNVVEKAKRITEKYFECPESVFPVILAVEFRRNGLSEEDLENYWEKEELKELEELADERGYLLVKKEGEK